MILIGCWAECWWPDPHFRLRHTVHKCYIKKLHWTFTAQKKRKERKQKRILLTLAISSSTSHTAWTQISLFISKFWLPCLIFYAISVLHLSWISQHPALANWLAFCCVCGCVFLSPGCLESEMCSDPAGWAHQLPVCTACRNKCFLLTRLPEHGQIECYFHLLNSIPWSVFSWGTGSFFVFYSKIFILSRPKSDLVQYECLTQLYSFMSK